MKKTFIFIIAFCLCFALPVLAQEHFLAGSDTVCFVAGADGNDANAGTSAAPFATLARAYEALAAAGGTVVVTGEVPFIAGSVPAAGGAVLYTSVYGGTDYRESGAKLVLNEKTQYASDTFFENVHISAVKSNSSISGGFHNLGFGYGITVTNGTGTEDFIYPVIVGGYDSPAADVTEIDRDCSVYVCSGTFAKVYGGNRRNTKAEVLSHLTGDLAVIIRGGSFTHSSVLEASGMNVLGGRLYVEISGGEFAGTLVAVGRLGTIDATTAWKPDADYTADVLVRITGGNFQKRFRLAQSDLSAICLTYPPLGDATVEITGGTFADYTVGYGMAGQVLLRYDPAVLSLDRTAGFATHTTVTGPAAAETENVQFLNPIGDKADPYVIQKDGLYYYCFSSAGIGVAVHGNIPFGTLSTQFRRVFTPDMTDIAMAKKEYWAPELHYFDAETVGAENAGWYIYFAADDGDNYNHRMYVLRATDPEDPMSDYEMLGKITSPDDHWAIDGTVMVLGGKLYFIWSGWEGTTNVAQDIYIAPMSDPWTVSGARVRLSKPEYAWETRGGSPKINEGPQILQEGGTTHIIYSASGSWSRYYCYGALTLIGDDPLNPAHWYKSPTPLFESGNGIYGTGHGSFVKDMEGNHWMFYHANHSTTVPSGSTWWAERETYAKRYSFVQKTIGDKTVTYPDFGTPAAYQGAQSITTRVTDYHAEGEHHWSLFTEGEAGTLRRCYICGETEDVRMLFAPTLSGEMYDRMAARASENAFTLLCRTRAASVTEALLPYTAETLPAAEYAYAARGAFLAPVTVQKKDGEYTVAFPAADVEAIVLSAVPLVAYGDTDGDGQISLLDVLCILRAILSDVRYDVACADMNGDLSLSVSDVLLALQELLN